MVAENPLWGYTRIRGAPYNLGHEVGRTMIKRILDENGIEPAPLGMRQIARNLTSCDSGVLVDADYLIHDRDPLYTKEFRQTFTSVGVRTVRLPARRPNLNAHAERFVRSIKSECLARIIPLSERHLRDAVTAYTQHYHVERNHQGLGNHFIQRSAVERPAKGKVLRRERIGGTLNFYYREAA